MSAVTVERQGSGVRFRVRLQPRASRDEIAGVHGGALKIRLHAPPVDGAANEALVAPRRAIRIVTGATSRTKLVEVEGVTSSDVARLADSSTEARSR